MATLRNKRTLAALNKENCEEKFRNNQAQNTSVTKSQEEYFTQVSEEIEGRMNNKLSKEFSWTGSSILRTLSRLDEFLPNELLRGHSVFAPETSRNALNIKPGSEWGRLPSWSSFRTKGLSEPNNTLFGSDDSSDNPKVLKQCWT